MVVPTGGLEAGATTDVCFAERFQQGTSEVA